MHTRPNQQKLTPVSTAQQPPSSLAQKHSLQGTPHPCHTVTLSGQLAQCHTFNFL